MATPLRALLVEDSEDDAELLLRQLRRGGYEPTHARVDTPEAMSAELAGRPWDIVFSGYSMAHFNAFDALALIKNTGLDLPFIIVSGTISEDRAVIDDFGTGYTSLAIIQRLPIDEIKIDKAFVMGMLADKKDAVIVRAVIELGHNLGLSVVAEGLETQETLDALADLGCDEAQGYFICKPQACGPLKNWLLTSPWKLEATA
jgi:CheY-like chemotaxis protein